MGVLGGMLEAKVSQQNNCKEMINVFHLLWAPVGGFNVLADRCILSDDQ